MNCGYAGSGPFVWSSACLDSWLVARRDRFRRKVRGSFPRPDHAYPPGPPASSGPACATSRVPNSGQRMRIGRRHVGESRAPWRIQRTTTRGRVDIGGGTGVWLNRLAPVHAPGRGGTVQGARPSALGTYNKAGRRSRIIRQLAGRLVVPIARFTKNINWRQVDPHHAAPITTAPQWINTRADLGAAKMRLSVS
jgi:hypothetical protein